MRVAAVAGTGLAVVSGAAGWDTAHRRARGASRCRRSSALVAIAWVSARRLLAGRRSRRSSLFGLAALLTGRDVHLAARGARVRARPRCSRAAHVPRRSRRRRASSRDYVTLTKPRIMSLLLLTGAAGVFVGAGGVPAAGAFAATMVGLALACGGAVGAQPLPRPRHRQADGVAHASSARSPSGRVPPERALEFGLALSAFSFVLLDSLVNLPTALLALAGNLFYVLVYTRWLKRSTAAEHRHRRRGGRGAAARRLRRRDGPSRLGGARDVRRSSSCGRRRTSGRWR